MPGHVVFVRFFVGYTPAFPFGRFDPLPDDAVAAEAEAIRREWWDDPENRGKFGSWDVRQREQQALSGMLTGRGRHGPLIPGLNVQHISVVAQPRLWDEQSRPDYLDVAEAAGWRWAYSDDFPPYRISGRYPVARFDDRGAATDAAAALQTRMAEVFRGAEAATDTGEVRFQLPDGQTITRVGGRDERSVIVHQAGPRFFVLAEAYLSRAELVNIRERISRLNSLPVLPPDPTERLIRLIWPALRPTLDHLPAGTASHPEEAGPPPAEDITDDPQSPDRTSAPQKATKQKKSTVNGDRDAKLIPVLTKHHKYRDGGCLNLEPIGSNESARQADVSPSTASAFFQDKFKGYAKYRVICRDAGRLADALKLLNGEFSLDDLYGRRPPGEDERGNE